MRNGTVLTGRGTIWPFALFASTCGCFGASSSAPTAASSLIEKSVAVNNRDWKAQDDYSFTECDAKSKMDSDGQVKPQGSKTFDVVMIDGSLYRRLVAVNNEPVSPGQQTEEQDKLNREIAHRKSESERDRKARIDKYQSQRAEEHLLMQQMVTAFDFTLLGEENVNGVACYRLKATPKLDYNPPVEKARVLKGMRGVMWIDKQQYHWVKVEAEVTEPVSFGFFIAKVNPGTRFELDQSPLGSVWLPKHFIQTVNASVFGVYGIRNREEFSYSNYRENSPRLPVEASLR